MGKGRSLLGPAGIAATLGAAALAALLLGAPASALQDQALHASLHILKDGTGAGTVRGREPVGDNIETQINCGQQCVASVVDTTDKRYVPMTLTAIADPGSTFKRWSGDCVGTETTCTMGPIGRLVNYYVTATFDLTPADAYPVAVATSGEGRVTSAPAGIDCGTSCAASFKTGSAVTLTAVPAAGWSFAGWGGACQGVTPCSLAIDGPKSVEATFSPPSFRLTVAAAGSGSVTSDPAGISCGATCSALFPSGSAVTLTAAGDGFAGWGGACSGSGPTCTVTMSAARAVTALWSDATAQPLAVSVSGPGSVRSDRGGVLCGSACATAIPGGAVTLTATPSAGSRFTGWSGACSGTARTCALTMSAARAVVAVFAKAPASYPLAVTASGQGVVTSEPAGIRCKPTCTASIKTGSTLVLTAVAAKRWTFVRWAGACTGRKPTCNLVMSGARTVAATFARNADQQAPRITALPSTGARGAAVRLRYRVTDDSGKSREWATVYRGTRKLAVVQGRLDEADPEALFYFLRWKAPRTLPPGTLRFCVQAADATGNTSARSCARLRLT